MGFTVDCLDENGHSPLMLAAREGHADACKLLIQWGGDCELVNSRGETALSLARRSNGCKVTESVIFNHLARSRVLVGEELCKHIREGRGSPHAKTVQMLMSGLLTWGKSRRRNVVCKVAVAGPNAKFLKNQRKNIEDEKRAIFRVATDTGREVHFEAGCATGLQLCVCGINLIIKEDIASGV